MQQSPFSGVYDRWKNSIFNKATIENIGADKYSQLLVTCPPVEEQRIICEFIVREMETINLTIERVEKELTLLQEYRTTLIAEAVTGKIDVRDWKPKQVAEELEQSLNQVQAYGSN